MIGISLPWSSSSSLSSPSLDGGDEGLLVTEDAPVVLTLARIVSGGGVPPRSGCCSEIDSGSGRDVDSLTLLI